MKNETGWSLSSLRYQSPLFVPWGNLGAAGSKPNQEFFQAGSYIQGWGGGLGEHLGKTRGVGEKGALKGASVGWGELGERGERLPVSRSGQGTLGVWKS